MKKEMFDKLCDDCQQMMMEAGEGPEEMADDGEGAPESGGFDEADQKGMERMKNMKGGEGKGLKVAIIMGKKK